MSLKSFNLKIPPPLLSREHGSWAVLLLPMFVSLGVVGKWGSDFIWVALSGLGVFFSYVPAQVLLRNFSGAPQRKEKVLQAAFWGSVYAIAGLAFASILLKEGYVLLLAIGGAGILCFMGNFYLTKKYSKSIWTDFIAVAGLTLSGPSAYYVLIGMIDGKAVLLYILNLLFFGCTVFYVHMKIHAASSRKHEMTWGERFSIGRMNLLYHAAVIALVGILAALRLTPAIVLLAFVPMVVQGIYGTIKLSGNVRFKNLGLILLGQSVVFGSILCRTLL
jgi:YwiC-like protein